MKVEQECLVQLNYTINYDYYCYLDLCSSLYSE